MKQSITPTLTVLHVWTTVRKMLKVIFFSHRLDYKFLRTEPKEMYKVCDKNVNNLRK